MSRIDLGERPTSRRELAAWYAGVVKAQAASGMSLADWARRIGVAAPTLYQWRRRLESSSEADPRSGRLVEVTVAPARTDAVDGVVVRLCEGRRSVEVPRGFDDDDLRRVIAVLESC